MRRLDTIYRIKNAKEMPQRLQFYVFPRPKSFSAAVRLISARIFALILIIALSYNFYTFFFPQASASNFNKQINYQGKITDASNVAIADNPYCFKFRLMDDLDPAPPENEVWSETWTGANKITTTSGLFSAMLGTHQSLAAIDFNQVLYLEVQFDPGCDAVYEEVFAPRKILGAVPAAFEADKLDGIDSGSFARSDADDTITGLWTITKAPAGAGVNQGSLYINPAAANADETLFGVALNGAERFRVDEDGDLTAPGTYNTNTFTSSALTFGAAGPASVSSAAGQQLTIDSGTTGNLYIGTGASQKTIIIGNETGATSLELDSGTGAISIGNAIAKTITLGNVTGATAVNLNSGTGGFLLTSTGAGDFTVASGDDVVINGAGADAAISIGTAAVAHTIIIGNETGASSLELDSGTGAISIGNAIAKTINIGNATGATGLVFNTGTAGIDFGDNANTKAIHIGGVTNSGTDTISIATNSTAADVITIGNNNAATTLALTGGTAWSVSTAGLITTDSNIAVNGGNITTTAATFNLINASATAVNFAGAASAIRVGAAAGTTTFLGDVDVDYHMALGVGALGVPITPSSDKILNITDSTDYTGVNYGIYLLESTINENPTTYYGIYSRLDKWEAGTTTNNYNFYAAGPVVNGGSITNNYGLYVADQTGGGVDIGIAIAGADTYALWISSGANNTDAANGITFGSSGDTNLYRSAANTLKTDDTFIAAGTGAHNFEGTLTIDAAAGAKTERLCQTGGGSGDGVLLNEAVIGDCSAASQADFAEYYGSDGSLEPGDLVVIDPDKAPVLVNTSVGAGSKAWVLESSSAYDQKLVGIVSTNPFIDILSDGVFSPEENPVPVSLSGRVPLKVSTENGPIQPGDALTSSSEPGVAMKATQSGPVVGKALESFDGADNENSKIMVFVNVSYYISEGDIAKLNSEINTESGGIVDSIKNGFSDLAGFFKLGLEQLGIFVENGVVKAKEFIADKITAKLARVEKLEMVDKATGEIYCTWIENGEWKKTKGECDSANSGNEQPSGGTQPSPPEQPPAEPSIEPPPVEEPPPSQEPPAIGQPPEPPSAGTPAGTSASESLPAS